MKLIDGNKIASDIKEEIRAQVPAIEKTKGRPPHLVAVLAGNDGASKSYVGNKIKTCKALGFRSTFLHFEDDISEDFLLKEIQKLNEDDGVDGFIVQLPLPRHINTQKVTLAINPAKDVDGFHPENIGRLALGLPGFVAATPWGIVEMIKRMKIETAGKNCVILGRSHIVGMPMSLLMSRNDYPGNCTVTICHSKTKYLEEISLGADILIAAIGKPEFVKSGMVKEGATVIDVGITRVEDKSSAKGYKLAGDVDFEDVSPKCEYITPVPGGVGPMTIVALLNNTLKAARGEMFSK